MTKQCFHHRFWTKEGPRPWFLHGIGEAGQLPGCVGTWLPPPHGAATTGAQVTQHLQLKPPTACLACRLQYSQSRGQASQGPQLTGSASGSPKRGSGMTLSGFQKPLQFLQPWQILEWTHGSLTPAPTPSPMPAPTCRYTYNTTNTDTFCPWLVRGLEALGKTHHGVTAPEMPPSFWIKNWLVPTTFFFLICL